MIRHILAIFVLCVTAVQAGASPSASAMYADARAREETLRAAWNRADDRSAPAPTLAQVRAVITAYRAIVGRYPRSGYSDNALYQAAGLAAEAYTRLGSARERNLASELLRTMIREYPTSSLVPAARILVGDLETAAARPVPASPRGPDASAAARSAGAPAPPGPPPVATITAIRRSALSEGVRITVEFDRPAVHTVERLDDPARLVVDFASTAAVADLRHATLAYPDGLVRQVRLGHHPQNMTRVVLDLSPATQPTLFTLAEPYRVVIDCEPGPATEPAAPPAPLTSRQMAPASSTAPPLLPATLPQIPPGEADTPGGKSPPSPSSADATSPPDSNPAAATTAGPRAGSVAAPAPDPLPARPNPTMIERPPRVPTGARANGVSMARQLGLDVARIVIDPGHGGRDPGAKAAKTTEAQVVLDIALRLEKLLLAQPGIEVVLTRRTDVYVPLEERTAIANREEADLFLSIHANASRNTKASGIETYLLDFAATPDAAAVAARENASSGLPISNLPQIVRAITLTNKLDESRAFATQVQQSMYRQIRTVNRDVRNLGVKRAPFVVLIGATMPSVLVEVSFLTNPREGQLLAGASYRQRVAEALLEGIQRYQKTLRGAVVVASQ